MRGPLTGCGPGRLRWVTVATEQFAPGAVARPAVPVDRVRVLDLFAGAGGLTCGFREASDRFKTVRAVEMDRAAAATYTKNHGDVVYRGTIQDWLYEEPVPDAEIVIGGPPCQGFSTLGKQDEEDVRNLLWHEYAETVRQAGPKYFVLENVPAFLTSAQFGELSEAAAHGGPLSDYEFEAHVLNAADYGAAQARRRIVVIGHRRGLRPPGIPAPTHAGQHRTLAEALRRVRRSVGALDLPGTTTFYDGHELPGVFRTTQLHVGRRYTPLSVARFAAIPAEGNRFDLPTALQARCWRDHTSGSGDVMGRLAWDKPSVTIRTEFFKPEKGRYLHPDEDRVITHYEAALIQGFPKDYKWVGSKTAIARQIGNAVPIPLGQALAAHLLGELDAQS